MVDLVGYRYPCWSLATNSHPEAPPRFTEATDWSGLECRQGMAEGSRISRACPRKDIIQTMDRHDSSDVTSRRTFIRLGTIAGSLSCVLAQPQFWNTKDPADYSDDEKHGIIANSPWAKVTHADAPGVSMRRLDGFASAPCTPSIPGSCASNHPKTVVVQASPQPEDAKEALAFYGPVTVRWESAKPILQVTRTALPNEFRNHYVISVTGLPVRILSQTSNGMPLPNAELSAGKHRPERAEFVALTSDKLTLLFAFPKGNPVIKASGKTVLFTMKLSGITIATRFVPQEMVYRGQLAL
jgi:hypothetical protein